MKVTKKITTIYISAEILEHAQKNIKIKSLSDYLNEAYYRDFLNHEKQKVVVDNLKKELQKAENELKHLETQKEDIMASPIVKWLKKKSDSAGCKTNLDAYSKRSEA